MEESITLEETNKIRISLGLKPLVDDAGPANDSEKLAEANYAKHRDVEGKQRESKKIVERIAKVRNRQELHAKLKGATLGDDEESEDTLQWVRKAKKRERELAKKRQEEFESRDNVVQDEYTERDLVGLKVSHDFDEMNEGETKILTLRDSRVIDDDEDELQNLEMVEDAKTKKRKDLKTKSREYTGYDDDEFVIPGAARSVLAKYDEDIEGVQETGFRLGGGVMGSSSQAARAGRGGGAAVINKPLLSIDYAKNIEIVDYLREGDIGFKKPKTKAKRSSRRAQPKADPDDDVGDTAMVTDDKPIAPRARDLNTNFVDDDELQAALARSRRAKIMKTKKLSPQEIAAKLAAERVGGEPDPADEITGGLTFDDTSEFVRAVQYNPVAVDPEHVETPVKHQPRDISIGPADEPMEEIEAGQITATVKEEEEDEGVVVKTEETEHGDSQDLGTSSQQNYSCMASTLNILRQQGILNTPTADQVDRERTQVQRDLWLAEQRLRLSQREMEKLQGRGQNKDNATREYDNRMREQQEARDSSEAFKNYKPAIDLTEYDEFGRAMTRMEAWKALSHKFHGKGSGKMKLEKRLKKIAEEKKREAMVSGDTPLGMNKAFQQLQEKSGQAHFVLSVGNRGAIPQAAEYFDSQPLKKGKSEKKLKKGSKAVDTALAAQEAAGFMTLPAPQTPFTMSPDPNGGSPAPKPGFSRISTSTVEDGTASQDSTPVPSDRTKVTFTFGSKRKAVEDVLGTPPPKRR